MTKLLSAVLAGVFAVVTVAPVAFAADKKEESKEMAKSKADEGKAKAAEKKADKADMKKKEEKK